MTYNNISHNHTDPYAGFWRRTGAWFIDGILIYVTYLLIAFFIWDDLLTKTVMDNPTGNGNMFSYAPSLLGLLVVGVAVWLYIALQESGKTQASIGKRVFGIKVCNYSGDKVSFVTASYRAWPLWLPGLINAVAILDLLVSLVSLAACLSVAFTKRKQGLHDIMAGCLVVKRRAIFSDSPRSGEYSTSPPRTFNN